MARRMGDDDRPVQARSRAPLTNDGAIDMWLEMYSWPLIDLSDPDAINQRLAEYLDLCKRYNSKPEVSGWCQTIGTTRIEVLDWSKGKRTRLDDVLTTASAAALSRSLGVFEFAWEYAMQNGGYAYPVTGIFLGKNNFGYKDESETLVTHSSERKGPTMAELESKYAQALPEEVPAEDVVIEVPEMARLPKGRRKRGDR